MKKRGMNRREFLKLTGPVPWLRPRGLGGSLLAPKWVWGATPAVKGPVKVGYQAILSGTLAGYGEFHKMGAVMAVEEINAKAGSQGRRSRWSSATRRRRRTTRSRTPATSSIAGEPTFWPASTPRAGAGAGPRDGQLDRVLMVTHAATEKLTEEFVFKKGVKQIFRTACPPTTTGTPRPSSRRTSPP